MQYGIKVGSASIKFERESVAGRQRKLERNFGHDAIELKCSVEQMHLISMLKRLLVMS